MWRKYGASQYWHDLSAIRSKPPSYQFILCCVFHSDQNFKNSPEPCSGDTGTWLSTAATVLFFVASIMSCCIPKPVPILVRAKNFAQKEDKRDPCCMCCKKKEKGDEEEGDEEATEEEEVEKVRPLFAWAFILTVPLSLT